MAPWPMTPLQIPTAVPDVAFGWEGPWDEPVDELPVDRDRTAGLATLNPVVRLDGHTPLQVAADQTTRVTTWSGWFPTGTHAVPLPEKVWLLRNGDDQWFGVDLDEGFYWECASMGPSWLLGPWRADAVRRFDLSRPWNQHRGLAGGAIPIWALIALPYELRAGSGGLRRALNWSVAGNYAKATVPWVSKSDGTLAPSRHPLRAGERLRLTAEAYQRLTGLARTVEDFAYLWALRHRGAIVNDKTSATAGHAIRGPFGVQPTITVVVTDFEVVAA